MLSKDKAYFYCHAEPAVKTIAYERRRQQDHRELVLEDLPVETVGCRLSEEGQICPKCAGRLHEMNTEVRQEIKLILAQPSRALPKAPSVRPSNTAANGTSRKLFGWTGGWKSTTTVGRLSIKPFAIGRKG